MPTAGPDLTLNFELKWKPFRVLISDDKIRLLLLIFILDTEAQMSIQGDSQDRS